MAAFPKSERRKSDRISVSLPVHVHGTGDESGLSEPSKTVEVGRSGAKFPLMAELKPNQRLNIQNLRRETKAAFRVIGRVPGPDKTKTYWAVECLDSPTIFWGINFPPLQKGQEAAGRVLLKCVECDSQELSYLSDLETEVFGLTSRVLRECSHCNGWKDWIEPEPGTEALGPAPPDPPPEEEKPQLEPPRPGGKPSRRANRRLSLEMDACIQTRDGEEEVGRTINISKGGLAVLVRGDYPKDSLLKVAFPYNAGGGNIFVLSRVVRAVPSEEEGVVMLGIQYLR